MDLKSIKPVHLAIIAVAIIGIAAVLMFVQPLAAEEANNRALESWEIRYLGLINADVVGDERQAHLDAFIEHNAGVKDACEIMYFYDSHCGACLRLAPWLEEFREQYPEILFTSYEMHDNDSRVRLESARVDYGISSPSVPIIFICGSVVEGVEPIQSMLQPMALSVYNLPIR